MSEQGTQEPQDPEVGEGVLAAHTDLPFIGVPLTTATSVSGGLDALLGVA